MPSTSRHQLFGRYHSWLVQTVAQHSVNLRMILCLSKCLSSDGQEWCGVRSELCSKTERWTVTHHTPANCCSCADRPAPPPPSRCLICSSSSSAHYHHLLIIIISIHGSKSTMWMQIRNKCNSPTITQRWLTQIASERKLSGEQLQGFPLRGRWCSGSARTSFFYQTILRPPDLYQRDGNPSGQLRKSV